MTGTPRIGIALTLAIAVLASPAGAWARPAEQAPDQAALADRMTGDITGVHDPAIIRQGDLYYVFSTTRPREGAGQIPIRTSPDLVNWTRAGHVFTQLPDWAKREIPRADGIWAPDISYAGGQYRLYYAVSTFGSNHSVIGLATSPTLDSKAPNYGWSDQGPVIASTTTDDFNAIDPAAFTDREGKSWLVFGSFWSGIKMVRIDPATGKRSSEDGRVHSLARRPKPNAIEAPFLIERGGFYYLFASHDFCCRGADSTYYTMVGRSRDVTGPYVDADGKPLMEGYGQIVLHARLDPTGRWRGPGHVAVLKDGKNYYIAYHAYDARNRGIPTLRIAPLGWTADGWPVARF